MKKALVILSHTLSFIVISCTIVKAVVDPLSVPNNRVGVHIFDPGEIEAAVKLVNSNGGDWGYVTVLVRLDDLHRDKWTKFFDDAKKLHIIPIVRLSTQFENGSWKVPSEQDIVRLADFLNSFDWPTKNRYIVLFNEPNHTKEWGGQINPVQFTKVLSLVSKTFKAKSNDFYLLSAGLDMAAGNTKTTMNALEFYRQMHLANPKWHELIDGLAVHIYPNNHQGILSYRTEQDYLRSLGYPAKHIFITESAPSLIQPWTDINIVAITPFVLFAGTGDFARFSLLTPSLSPTQNYLALQNLSKTSGSPVVAEAKIAKSRIVGYEPAVLGISTGWRKWWEWFFPKPVPTPKPIMAIQNHEIVIEVAQTERQRQKGLSGRQSLAENAGMLFKMDSPARHSFWMKDMNFALDFIWLRNNKVVEITENVLPPSQTNGQPQVITPANTVDSVLEVNPGFVRKNDIKVGDGITSP